MRGLREREATIVANRSGCVAADVREVGDGREQLQFANVRRRVGAIFVGSIGNLVEWYDFYAYSAFALYFADALFQVQTRFSSS